MCGGCSGVVRQKHVSVSDATARQWVCCLGHVCRGKRKWHAALSKLCTCFVSVLALLLLLLQVAGGKEKKVRAKERKEVVKLVPDFKVGLCGGLVLQWDGNERPGWGAGV
jgi:hypothetical protein